MNHNFTEALESRVLMSGNPMPLSDAVMMDRTQIRLDLLKFKADIAADRVTLFSDLAAIKMHGGKNHPTLTPLLQKYRNDLKSMDTALRQDRLTEKQNVLNDMKMILADMKQVRSDQGNTEALIADRAKLLNDRIRMQSDMVAGLNSRIATRQAFSTLLIADDESIVNAINGDENASDELKADVVRWTTDRSAADTLRSSDLAKLVADRVQLVNDLTAMQSA